jgi:hypothetical protein
MIPRTNEEVQINCQKARRDLRRWRRKGSGGLDSAEVWEGGALNPSNSAASVRSASLWRDLDVSARGGNPRRHQQSNKNRTNLKWKRKGTGKGNGRTRKRKNSKITKGREGKSRITGAGDRNGETEPTNCE